MSDVNGQGSNGQQAPGQAGGAASGQVPPRPPMPPRPPVPGAQPASEQPTQALPTEPFPTQAFPTAAFPTEPFPTRAFPPQQQSQPPYPGQAFGAPPVPVPPGPQQYPGQPHPGQQYPTQPYAGQPGGAGYGGAGYGGAGYPGPGFGGPVPGGEPPRRRGMPGWAIAATAVGVAVLIGGGITAAVLLTQQPSEPLASDSPSPSASSSSPEPTAEPTPSQDDTPSPTPSASTPDIELISGEYMTDVVAPFTTGPFWSVQVQSDWSIDEFDQGGWNRFSNAEGCVFETYQGLAELETNPDTDQDATFLFHDDLIETIYLKDVPPDTREQTEYGYQWFTADTDGEVEFLFDEFVYPDADGVSRTIAIASRTFSATDVTLFTMLNCPSEAIDAAPELFDDTIGSAKIVSW